MEELLAAAAAKMNMSEKMVQRSAEAKAKASGVSVESILAEWVGVEAPAAPSAPASPTETTAPSAAEASAPAAAAPADPGALLAAAAAKMNMSEKMVQRSAEAKAKAGGVSVESILAEWAGVEAPAASSAAPAAAAAAPAAAAAVETASPEEPSVEVIGETGAEEEPAAEDVEPEPVEPVGALPKWLVALFLIIPAFAIGYLTFLPNGPNCGDAGRLGVDPVSGAAANCDGSAYGSSGDPYTQGATIYASAGCAACHGASGTGGGNFPAFTGGALLTTFPAGQCDMQIEWVTLGTNGWPDPTYGANNKPVGGSGATMPAWGSVLTAEEIQAVVVYERVAFGGEDLTTALGDCAPPAAAG